jgi:DNA-binding MarR family transcriptional regulator
LRTAERVRYLILAAQREGNRQLTAFMGQIGLTPAQSEALRIVADHGPLALKELGDMLVCDSGTSPSRIVDKLVAAGLVHRQPSEQDRRQIRLTVSPQGRERAAQVAAIEDQLYAAIDAAMDGVDTAAFIQVLQTLTHGSPAGLALEKRVAVEEPPPSTSPGSST